MIPNIFQHVSYLSEAQKKNLWIGTQIRNLVCMDSLAHRFLSAEDHAKIRAVVDANMSALGYETLTQNRERSREAFRNYDKQWTNKQWKEFYKFKKVEI